MLPARVTYSEMMGVLVEDVCGLPARVLFGLCDAHDPPPGLPPD